MKWTKEKKEQINYIIASVAILTGIVLIFCGLFLPPVGEISATVLTGVGEFLTFGGAILGINQVYKGETEAFKGEVRGYLERRIREKEEEEDEQQ